MLFTAASKLVHQVSGNSSPAGTEWVTHRKRATIHARADELGIRVLNRRRDA